MKILNDDGPLRVEDHDDKIRVVHKHSGKVLREEFYAPGVIVAWQCAFATARGFQHGWRARKEAQYAAIITRDED